MRGLVSLVRQQRDLSQLAVRAFASAASEVAVASDSPFLRFSNPYPAAVDHTPLLSTIPETQVGVHLVERWSLISAELGNQRSVPGF